MVYLDDILIYSKSPEEHAQHVEAVLSALEQHHLYAKASKCQLGMAELDFLGHTISGAGIKVDARKVKAILEWPEPSDAHQLGCFLGLAGFYRRFVRGAVYVPSAADLRQVILREYHDTPFSGHLGMDKLLQGVSKDFWWPHQRDDVADYVRTCDSCQRNKLLNRAPAGLLQPLPTPERNWEQITMDLITGLPTASEGHDTILVIVDRMSKMIHCAPTRKTITGPGLADLVINNVFRYHGLPRIVIPDRDPRTTSNFWRALFITLGTKLRVSTAFHPQTDGQTERANRTLEEMLRAFSTAAATTGTSSHPSWSLPTTTQSRPPPNRRHFTSTLGDTLCYLSTWTSIPITMLQQRKPWRST